MSDIQLTKEDTKFIATIYKEFLDRRDRGDSKEVSASFHKPSELQEELFPKWNLEDITSCELDLKRIGFLKVYIDNSFVLENKAIVYMENRFKNGAKEVLSFIGSLL